MISEFVTGNSLRNCDSMANAKPKNPALESESSF